MSFMSVDLIVIKIRLCFVSYLNFTFLITYFYIDFMGY